jgi:hypothetical protein
MRKCFRKFSPIEEELAKVKEEYTRFATSSEEFNDHESINDRWMSNPMAWWTNHGSSIPLLRSLAIKLISQTSLIFPLAWWTNHGAQFGGRG